MHQYTLWFFTSISILFASMAFAATDDAATLLIKQVTTEMTTALTQQKAAIQKDPNTIVDIVDKLIVQHIDFGLMSKSVLARHWQTATPAQRTQFQEVFSRWAVFTYSAAFLYYTDQKIEFGKPRPIGNKGDREEVLSFIVENNGKKIPVNYRMVKTGNEWKAYDINVENISLVASFRTQIDSEINRKGLDTVIKELNERNKKGLVKSK